MSRIRRKERPKAGLKKKQINGSLTQSSPARGGPQSTQREAESGEQKLETEALWLMPS